MKEPVYLKITPEAFRLEQEQMFMLDNCQFCGSNRLNYTKMGDSGKSQQYWLNFCHRQGLPYSRINRTIAWRTHCPKCKSTNAIILERQKDKTPG